jgi:hypothetical protein
MILNTVSAVISFANKLEADSATFYEELSCKYNKYEDTFSYFAEENVENLTQIKRAYYELISDAIEGCFTFNISPKKYIFLADLTENTSYADALNKAVEIEEKVIQFYYDTVKQAESLIAGMQTIFMIVAKKRGKRISKLKALLQEGEIGN